MNVDPNDIRIPRNRMRPLDVEWIKHLAASFAEIGLLNPPSVTPDLVLIAGHHRIAAAKMLKWATIPVVVVKLDELRRRLGEIDENLIRNELTVLERAEHFAERKKIYLAMYPETKQGGAPGAGQGKGKNLKVAENATFQPSFASDTAAKTRTSARTIRQDVQIADALSDDTKEAVRGTALADCSTDLLALARVADPKQQIRLAKMVIAGKEKSVADASRSLRLAERHDRNAAISESNASLPQNDRLYSVIYADPPWQYEHAISVSREIEEQYPTASTDKIAAMPVAALAADDCVLFLWTPPSLIKHGLRVLDSWGFIYRTLMVWDKEKIGMGFWVRQQVEIVLIGVKGSPPTPLPADRPSSMFRSPRGAHSKKPEAFYSTIETMWRGAARIELFARGKRAGWDVWGNQT